MNKEQILNEMTAITAVAQKENRGLNEAEEKRFNELEAQLEVIKKESRAIKMQEELRAEKKPETRETKDEVCEVREMLIRGITEKRAVTVNGGGASAYVRDVVMAGIEKASWLSKLDYMIAANATTTIPILSPIPANAGYYAEGSTSVSGDSTAVYAGKSLTPRSYISLLQVSKAAMTMTELGRQIDRAYQKVMLNTIHEEVVTGSGNNSFVGLDVTTNKTVATSGSVDLKALIDLAIKAQSKLVNPMILINPTSFSSILAASPTSPIMAAIFQTMRVYDVPLYVTSNLADGDTANEVWAVAFDPDNYAVAIAAELSIDTINVKGDANTYFQAYMFADGKEKVSSEVFYNIKSSS